MEFCSFMSLGYTVWISNYYQFRFKYQNLKNHLFKTELVITVNNLLGNFSPKKWRISKYCSELNNNQITLSATVSNFYQHFKIYTFTHYLGWLPFEIWTISAFQDMLIRWSYGSSTRKYISWSFEHFPDIFDLQAER